MKSKNNNVFSLSGPGGLVSDCDKNRKLNSCNHSSCENRLSAPLTHSGLVTRVNNKETSNELLIQRIVVDPIAVRLRGNANNSNCCPRTCNSNNAVSNTNNNNAGSGRTHVHSVSPRVHRGEDTQITRQSGGYHSPSCCLPGPEAADLQSVNNAVNDDVCQSSVGRATCRRTARDLAGYPGVIPSTPASIPSLTHITYEQVLTAVYRASANHTGKKSVKYFLAHCDAKTSRLWAALSDGTWDQYINYRYMHRADTRRSVHTQSHGGSSQPSRSKARDIFAPSLATRIYQHLVVLLLEGCYAVEDPHISYNCKIGHGINSADPDTCVIAHVRELVGTSRHLHYAIHIDQRACYDHVTDKLLRSSLRPWVHDPSLMNFIIRVCTVDGHLPVGTPSSPFLHHVVMRHFDAWAAISFPFALRYADDLLVAVESKQDAASAIHRIANHWWYDLHIRAKATEANIINLDATGTSPLSFCGYVYTRTDTGCYGRARRSTARRLLTTTSPRSYASRYGLTVRTNEHTRCVTTEAAHPWLPALSELGTVGPSGFTRVGAHTILGHPCDIISILTRRHRAFDVYVVCHRSPEHGPHHRYVYFKITKKIHPGAYHQCAVLRRLLVRAPGQSINNCVLVRVPAQDQTGASVHEHVEFISTHKFTDIQQQYISNTNT